MNSTRHVAKAKRETAASKTQTAPVHREFVDELEILREVFEFSGNQESLLKLTQEALTRRVGFEPSSGWAQCWLNKIRSYVQRVDAAAFRLPTDAEV